MAASSSTLTRQADTTGPLALRADNPPLQIAKHVTTTRLWGNSRHLSQGVQECIGFCYSSSTPSWWLPWSMLRRLLFPLLSVFWPQTAARLLVSCHLQQAEHVLVKVCLHQAILSMPWEVPYCMSSITTVDPPFMLSSFD